MAAGPTPPMSGGGGRGEAILLCLEFEESLLYFPAEKFGSRARAAEAAVEPSTLSVTVTDPGPLPTRLYKSRDRQLATRVGFAATQVGAPPISTSLIQVKAPDSRRSFLL